MYNKDVVNKALRRLTAHGGGLVGHRLCNFFRLCCESRGSGLQLLKDNSRISSHCREASPTSKIMPNVRFLCLSIAKGCGDISPRLRGSVRLSGRQRKRQGEFRGWEAG